MTLLAIRLLLSYLLGGVVGSLLLGRLRGVDIRRAGSGNAGATNALRTQGWRFALGVAAIDVGKGVIAALGIAALPVPGTEPAALSAAATGLACGVAAALGHCFPLWHGFRGGKGAGTLFGAVLALFPGLALAMLGVWLLVLTGTGFVGLSTVVAGIAFPLLLLATPLRGDTPLVMSTLLAAALVVWMHRGNLARLRAGTEPRFERARILARLLRRRDT